MPESPLDDVMKTANDRTTRSHPSVSGLVISARPSQYEQAVEMVVDALMEKPLDLPV